MKLANINIRFGNRTIIENASFQASYGQLTGIIGPSGAGKSSLLNIISLYRYEKSIDYVIDDFNLKNADLEVIQNIQKCKIAYLRQESQFINSLTCKELIQLECNIAGKDIEDDAIDKILNSVHLIEKSHKYPVKLSGGEKQRLALAMALAKGADIIICDEITSALDEKNTNEIINILQSLAHHQHKIVILATHEDAIMQQCDTLYEIRDYQLYLIKQIEQKKTKSLAFHLQKVKLPFKFYSSISWARMKKRWLTTIITIISSSIIVGCLSVAITFSIHSHNNYKLLVSCGSANELMVQHRTTPLTEKENGYVDYEPGFSSDFYSQLISIDGITAVYPIIPARITDLVSYPLTDIELPESILEIKQNGNVLKDYTFTVSPNDSSKIMLDYFDENIICSYVPENDYYNLAETKTSEPNGVFIEGYTAKQLKIDHLEDGMTLRCTLRIPCLAYNIPTSYGNMDRNGNKTFGIMNAQFNFYHTYIVELPISGILPTGYYDSIYSIAKFYFPQDIMSSLLEETKSLYQEKGNQVDLSQYPEWPGEIVPYAHKAWRVFYSSDIDPKELIAQILSLEEGETLSYADRFNFLNEQKEIQKEYDTYLVIVSIIVLTIVSIMQLTYSHYHMQEIIKEDVFFFTRGISTKEQKKITIAELYLYETITFVFSIIATNLVINMFLKGFNFGSINYYFLMLILDLVFSFLISLLSELNLLTRRWK